MKAIEFQSTIHDGKIAVSESSGLKAEPAKLSAANC